MRSRKVLGGMVVVLEVTCATLMTGCYDYASDCELTHSCLTSGGTGIPPGLPPACKGDPASDPDVVVETCGVFVNAQAASGGDGTRGKPYGSLREAIDKAKGKRVYACAGHVFNGKVTLRAGLEVMGGFDCNDWTWIESARSTIEGPPDEVTFTITDTAHGAKVRGFEIHAANATVPGGSSIAVAVADVEATLAQVDVTAGGGMDGDDGKTPTEAPAQGDNAPAIVSNACVQDAAVFGGLPGMTMCDGVESRGGIGGLGGIAGTDSGNGQAGYPGEPLPNPNPNGFGKGGDGQVTASGGCSDGQKGGPGEPGAAGVAGTSTILTLAGMTGGDGGDGQPGKPGQGGGGGGGAKAGVFCPAGVNPPIPGPGASGGGGGAGGCGGKGGGGGKAGGSSIGIVSLGARLMLIDVTAVLGNAGKGGKGADVGQVGALGGKGADGGAASGISPSKAGCTGGAGGTGGDGGPGGGGRGGHAIGIAYAVAPDAAHELRLLMGGKAGIGGTGGLGAPPESAGAPGAEGECWDFAANDICAK